MRRTGSAWVRLLGVIAALSATSVAAADDVEFYQTAEPTELGTEDTLRLTIVASNAPESARVQFPETQDFELLSRSQSTEMAYHLSGGGPGVIKRVTKWTLVYRPKRAGTLTIPSSLLIADGRNYRADPVKVTVKKGRLAPPTPRPRDPLADLFGLPTPRPAPDSPEEPRVQIPRTDSDLFLRSYVDKQEAYVGEQITLSVFVFSRVDLSSVDTLNMPKLEGFWNEEIDSPNQLAGDQRIINGVPYRSYLLRRRALFAVKPGTVTIEPAAADITTGFLFSNRRVHRKGNALELTIKPLPSAGKPKGFSASNVGQWRLHSEVTETEIELGQPTTVRVILEGRGNLKNVSVPPLEVPTGLRAFDPTTSARPSNARGALGGRRTQEYLVMPSQTGTFTLPGLQFASFDPSVGEYRVSRTDPITLTVRPARGGGGEGTRPAAVAEAPRNVLQATGARPLRALATFTEHQEEVWRRGFFLPAVLFPPLLFVALVVGGAVRSRLGREDPESARRKRARAARARLAAAEKLKTSGKADAFYGEVEKAVLGFLEAKLEGPVAGLTRDALDARMREKGVPEDRRRRVLGVLEQCDAARYSPMGGEAVRAQILDEAEAAMEGWR